MRGRKPADADAALAQGVDYLLRQFSGQGRKGGVSASGVGAEPFVGPIDYTYLVAAANARSEVRALADFVCDGVDDDEEIIAALGLLTIPGVVKLTEGTFSFNTSTNITFDIPAGCVLRGAGKYATIIEFTETNTLDIEVYGGASIELLKILGV